MTVLRDAGAAAIYGTNAANGVVLITTKRGEAGQKTTFEYTGSTSASHASPGCRRCSTRQQFRAAVEQFAPASRRPAAEREHRLVRRHRPDRIRPGAQRRACRAAAPERLSRLVQLPRPEGHSPAQQHPAHRPGRELEPAAGQRSAEPALQPPGLPHRWTDSRPSTCCPTRRSMARPSRSRIPTRPRGSTTGRATAPPRPTTRCDSSTWPKSGPRPTAPSATCRPSTGCRGSRGSGPISPSASTRATASGRNFLPSMLHREQATGRGGQQTAVQSAADQHGARDLSQLHHAAPGGSGRPRPDRRLLLDQDPHRLDLLRGQRGLSTDEFGNDQIVPRRTSPRTSCSSRRAS